MPLYPTKRRRPTNAQGLYNSKAPAAIGPPPNAVLGRPTPGPVYGTQQAIGPYNQGTNAGGLTRGTPGHVVGLTNAQGLTQGTPGPVGPNQLGPHPGGPQGPLLGQKPGASYGGHSATPTPQAPNQPIPLPVDPIYNEEIDRIHRALSGTEADLTYQQQQASQEYGLDDPTNPFSRAALLQRHYQQAQNAAKNSMAARGQLYSGALSNAFTSNAFNNQQGYDALQRGYQGTLYDIKKRLTDARYTAQDAERQSYRDRVIRALQNRPDTPPGNPPKKYGGFHPGKGGGGGKDHGGKHHHKPTVTNAKGVGFQTKNPAIGPAQTRGNKKVRRSTNARSVGEHSRQNAIGKRHRRGRKP